MQSDKAYELLGVERSWLKAAKLLGCQVQSVEEYVEGLRKLGNETPKLTAAQLEQMLRNASPKALALLGVDESLAKSSRLFGEDIHVIEQYLHQRRQWLDRNVVGRNNNNIDEHDDDELGDLEQGVALARTASQKAQDMLGIDSTLLKASLLLGIDVYVLEDYVNERKKRRAVAATVVSTVPDSALLKASKLLGERVSVLRDYVEQQDRWIEEQLAKQHDGVQQRVRRSFESGKALALLGVDPSLCKASRILGTDLWIVERAVATAAASSSSSLASAAASSAALSPSRASEHRKALALLGVEPSLAKASRIFGSDLWIVEQYVEDQRSQSPVYRASSGDDGDDDDGEDDGDDDDALLFVDGEHGIDEEEALAMLAAADPYLLKASRILGADQRHLQESVNNDNHRQ
jgi:hypothetical protein